MTKKKLNTESITNELEGASAFFTRQPQSRSLPQEEPEALLPEDQQEASNSTDDSNQVMQQDGNITSNITILDRKSTRLNSSHANISYAVFCLKKKKKNYTFS